MPPSAGMSVSLRAGGAPEHPSDGPAEDAQVDPDGPRGQIRSVHVELLRQDDIAVGLVDVLVRYLFATLRLCNAAGGVGQDALLVAIGECRRPRDPGKRPEHLG